MSYEQLNHLSAGEFKRLTGIKPETFGMMVEILEPDLERQGKRGGQNKLSVADQLLIVLEYWREYRTYFHIAQTWGLHESTVYRIVRKVETVLLASGQFRLPSRQDVRQNTSPEVVVIDVTEIEVERPKKTTAVL